MEEKLKEILISYEPGGMSKRDWHINKLIALFRSEIEAAMPEELPIDSFEGEINNAWTRGHNEAVEGIKSNLLKALEGKS